jgi:hypothetical protein
MTSSLPRKLAVAAALAFFAGELLAAVGTVQFSAGNVRLRDAAGKTRPVQRGIEINEGDTILSQPSGSAQLKMIDGGIIAVRPNTELKIDQYRYSGREDGSENAVMRLLSGGFRTITGLIGRTRKSNYKVYTPTATIGIRGTDHEPHFIPPLPAGVPARPGMPEPGTYDKVNVGTATITSEGRELAVNRNQVGFAAPRTTPRLLPVMPGFFRATPPVRAEAPKPAAKPAAETAQAGEKPAAQKPAAEAPAAQEAGSPPPTTGTETTGTTTTADTTTTTTTTTTTGGTDSLGSVDSGTPVATSGVTTTTTTTTSVPPTSQEGTQVITATDASGNVIDFTHLNLSALQPASVQDVFAATLLAPTGPAGAGAFAASSQGDASLYSVDTSGNVGKFSSTNQGTVEVLASATAQDAFQASDGSVRLGRWAGGSFMVDTTTVNQAPGSLHWLLALQPIPGVVQTYGGTVSYSKIGATQPTDAAGNVGTLNSASMSANFTAQTVDAAMNLSIASKTLGASATGMPISGNFFSTPSPSTSVTCTGGSCAGSYTADVKGFFAGGSAATAGYAYDIAGSGDLIQGVVAFQRTSLPTISAATNWISAANAAASSAGALVPLFNSLGDSVNAANAQTAQNNALALAAAIDTAMNDLLAASTTTAAATAKAALDAAILSAPTIVLQTNTTVSNLLAIAGPAALAQDAADSAQTAADQALLAYNAALADQTAANSAISTLNAIAPADTTAAASAISSATSAYNSALTNLNALGSPVDTTAASTAISNANADFTSAQTAVNSVNALAPLDLSGASGAIGLASTAVTSAQGAVSTLNALVAPDLTLATSNATTSTSLRTTAETQATQAQTAFTANGAFADPVYAASANTATQTAVGTVQAKDTLVQQAATDAVSFNTTYSSAKTSANAAMGLATTTLGNANSLYSTATTQSGNFTTAKSTANLALGIASTALTTANSALGNAIAANSQAATAISDAQTALNNALAELNTANSQLGTANTNNTTIGDMKTAVSGLSTQIASAVSAASSAATLAQTAANNAQIAANDALAKQNAGDLAGAQAALNTALTELNNATNQLSAATTAQGQVASYKTTATNSLITAQAALSAATTAVGNALSAAGNASSFASTAQANVTIASNSLSTAQSNVDTAVGSASSSQTQSGVASSQAGSANTAYGAAQTAAADATMLAGGAQTQAGTASAQASIASSAQGDATTAVNTTTTELANVQSAANTVTANYLQAQYSNPAVASSNFSHSVMAQGVPTTSFNGQYAEGGSSAGHANTDYVLNENKDLIEIRHGRFTGSNPSVTINDANVKYTGGVANDHFQAPDGSAYLGRWAGGQIEVTDLSSAVAPFTTSLGTNSAHWAIGLQPGMSSLTNTTGPVNNVQQVVGSANYTLDGATHPTDSFGNVGTLNSASLTANFSAQTVTSSLALSFVNGASSTRNLSLSATGTAPIKAGTPDFETPYTNVTCSGDCGTGYTGTLGGIFIAGASAGTTTGAVGTRAGATYEFSNSGSFDLVQGAAAFVTGSPPPVNGVTNTFTDNANVNHNVRYPGLTGSGETVSDHSRNKITLSDGVTTLTGPTTNTNYLFDGAGNLVRVFDAPWESTSHSTTLSSIGHAQISFGGNGSTAAEQYYYAPTGTYLGRWQGGDVGVSFVDSSGGFVDSLVSPIGGGQQSLQWIVTQSPTSAVIGPLTGQWHYTRIPDASGNPSFATSPTDGYGNVGVLNGASLKLDFDNMKASAGVRISINSGAGGALGTQNVGAFATDVPLGNGGGFNVASDPTKNAAGTDFLHVSCFGPGCDTHGYGGRIQGGITGTADQGAYFRYTFNTQYGPLALTPPAGRLMDDYIEGLVAFQKGPQIITPSSSPSAGPSETLAAFNYSTAFGSQSATMRVPNISPSNLVLDGGGNLVSVTSDEPFDNETRSLTLSGGTLSQTPSTSFANNAITLGTRTSSEVNPVTASGTNDCCSGSFSGTVQGGLAWVRGPAVFPILLSQSIANVSSTAGGPVVVGTRTFNLAGSTTPLDRLGNAGTLDSASLSVDFNRQAVNFGMQATTAGGVWNASASNLRLEGGDGSFFANYNPAGNTTTPSGLDTHDGLSLTYSGSGGAGYGNIAGTLTGAGITGAGVVYNFGSFFGDTVTGAIAFDNPNPYSIFTPYRIAAAVSGMNGAGQIDEFNLRRIDVGAIAPTRTQFVNGLPVKFDGTFPVVVMSNGCSTCGMFVNDIPVTYAITGATGVPNVGDASAVDTGLHAGTGLSWGRFAGGTANGIGVTDRITGTGIGYIDVTQNNVHYILTSVQQGPVVLPVTGAFVYNRVGNTSPTDNLGSTPGTLDSASVAADFVGLRVNASVGLTVAGNHWSATALGRPIGFGVAFNSEKSLDGSGSLAVTTDRVNSDIRTSGELFGVFTGQTGNGLALSYSLNQGGDGSLGGTPTTVSGVAAFERSTTPATVAPPPPPSAGSAVTFVNNNDVRVGSVFPVFGTSANTALGTIRDGIVSTSTTPTANTGYLFDAGGNLVQVANTQYGVFEGGGSGGVVTSTTGYTTPTPLGSVAVTYGGGGSVAAENYNWNDAVRLGRWQGGNVQVTDLAFGNTYTESLGNRSAQWLTYAQPLSLPTSGRFHYTRIPGTDGVTPSFATSPTDGYGNVGVLQGARVDANFTASVVSGGLSITMPTGTGGTLGTQNLGAYWSNAPIASDFTFNVGGNQAATAPANGNNFLFIGCNGNGCAPNQSYSGRVRGGFDGLAGEGAFFRYTFNTNYADAATATANGGRIFNDWIAGEVAFQKGPAINPPSAATAETNVAVSYYAGIWPDPHEFHSQALRAIPGAITLDGSGNLTSVVDTDGSGTFYSIVPGTTTGPVLANSANTGASTGISFGRWSGATIATNDFLSTVTSPFQTVGDFHWIKGPELWPFFITQIQTGSAGYIFDGGRVTDQFGAQGTFNTAGTNLSVNFNTQSVNLNLDYTLLPDTTQGGTQARNFIVNGAAIRLDDGGGFYASDSFASAATHNQFSASLNGSYAYGHLNGQFTGTGASGAVLGFSIAGDYFDSGAATTLHEHSNGAAAFAINNTSGGIGTLSSYRAGILATGLSSDSNLLADSLNANRTDFVISAAPRFAFSGGLPAAFDVTIPVVNDPCYPSIPCPSGVNSIPGRMSVIGSDFNGAFAGTPPATFFSATEPGGGFDSELNVRWGRYANGAIAVNDRITGQTMRVIDTTNQNVHLAISGAMAGPVTLPTSGTANYTLIGNTNPTDNFGHTGTLGSASLGVDFTNQTAAAAVNATVNGHNFVAATPTLAVGGVPIYKGAGFEAVTGGGGLTVTVTPAGGSPTTANTTGVMSGIFTGQTGKGAIVGYSLSTVNALVSSGSQTTINGVAVFKRP